MENKYMIFERLVINVNGYKDLFCILNKDEGITSNNVLQKLENLENQVGESLQTVAYAPTATQGSIFRGTLLHAAVASGYKKIVKALLEYGADIEATCFARFTPLHYTVIHDKAEIMELLINENANVNAVNLNRSTPLHLAAAKGSTRLVKILLSAGAEVNVADRNYNVPLHLAVHCKAKTETVRALVNFGLDVNVGNQMGNTVLHKIVLNEENIILLEGNLVPSKEEIYTRDSFSEIFKLNKSKKIENLVELFLKHRADPEIQNHYGLTVLQYSIPLSSVKVIKLLVRYGADVNARDIWGRAPLHYSGMRCEFFREDVSHIVYNLIKKGADIDSTCGNGLPTLHAIIKSNRVLARLVIRWAIIDNHEQEKPSYLKDYPGSSAYWDSHLRLVKQELERLSVEVEHKAIFDLLRCTNLNKLATLVKNENVFSKLNSCTIYYPSHAHQIIYKYEKGWKRFQLLKMSEECIAKLYRYAANSSRYLPKEIAREIAYYLTNKEIKNLITVQCRKHTKRKKIKFE